MCNPTLPKQHNTKSYFYEAIAIALLHILYEENICMNDMLSQLPFVKPVHVRLFVV